MVNLELSRDEAEALYDAILPMMCRGDVSSAGSHLERAFWSIVEACGMDSEAVEKLIGEG